MDDRMAVRDVVAHHWSLLTCPTPSMVYRGFVFDPEL